MTAVRLVSVKVTDTRQSLCWTPYLDDLRGIPLPTSNDMVVITLTDLLFLFQNDWLQLASNLCCVQ
jgi:hypothetical protein